MYDVSIRLEIEPLDEGGYVATSPEVPGLVAEGNTIEEVTALAYAYAMILPRFAANMAIRYRPHWNISKKHAQATLYGSDRPR